MARLIDADALVDAIKDEIAVDKEIYPDDEFFRFSRFGMRTVISIVKNQDTVDPVKHGHWTCKHNGYARCSACGGYFAGVYDYDNEDKYCRRCGAKMDGDEK